MKLMSVILIFSQFLPGLSFAQTPVAPATSNLVLHEKTNYVGVLKNKIATELWMAHQKRLKELGLGKAKLDEKHIDSAYTKALKTWDLEYEKKFTKAERDYLNQLFTHPLMSRLHEFQLGFLESASLMGTISDEIKLAAPTSASVSSVPASGAPIQK